jgi:ribonuclease HIII
VTHGTYTVKLPPAEAPRLRLLFLDQGFELKDAQYAFWQARGPGCVATFYTSGKLVLQGAEADAWRGLIGAEGPAEARPFHAGLKLHPNPPPPIWIGTDEAGKGDYFGPLVVAGVKLAREDIEILATLGVADSKTLGDQRLPEMVTAISATCDTEVLVISPARYNELYAKIGNLNRLLAWAHAKVIENLLERGAAPYVVVDKFAEAAVVEKALGPHGRAARVDQRPRAEEDPAVAAASVLARAAYLRGLAAAGRKLGTTLPAGAGAPVLVAGKALVARAGADVLHEVAKVHFATTGQILGTA